ncbi:hypothetical protein AtubIFM57258_009758 [Aspergillus tubingensis]|nr:hypothetical protein AtubIFM57258_009758 [Aspergillus tubingensis]
MDWLPWDQPQSDSDLKRVGFSAYRDSQPLATPTVFSAQLPSGSAAPRFDDVRTMPARVRCIIQLPNLSVATDECGAAVLAFSEPFPVEWGAIRIVARTPMGLSGVTTQQYPERRERTVEDERNEAYRGVDCETLGMTYPKNAESETGLEHVS